MERNLLKSKRSLLAILTAITFVCLTFVILQTNTTPIKVNAETELPEIVGDGGSGQSEEPEDTSFHMLDGIALARRIDMANNGQGMKLAFYVPQSIMTKYQAGNTAPYDELSTQHYEYYFCIYRLPAVSDYSRSFAELFSHFVQKAPITNSFSGGYSDYLPGSYCEFYHISPSSCKLTASSLYTSTDQGNGTYYCEVTMILPTYTLPDGTNGYEHEFVYFVDFFEYRPERTVINTSVGILNPNYIVKKSAEARHLNRTNNYTKKSVAYAARKTLELYAASYSEDEVRFLQFLAVSSTSSEDFTVNLKYKVCVGFNEIREITEQYNICSLYTFSGSAVFASLSGLKGFSSVAYFNCVFRNVRNVLCEGADVALLTDERIILQADSYTYSYDNANNVGTLEITYRDYQYKDFAIQVRDNDDSDGVDLTFYVYPVDVTTENGQIYLTYNYSRIQTMLLNSCGWLFELKKENFTCLGSNQYLFVNLHDDDIVIHFSPSHENSLVNLHISCLAEIIEDYECTMTLEYLSLDNHLNETTKTEVSTIMYSEYVKLGYGENLYNRYKGKINPAIHPECLNGLDFYHFSDIFCTKTGDKRYKITVTYYYTTLFKLTNSFNGEVTYQGLTKNSLTYYGTDLDFNIPSGYRISGLASTDKHSVTIRNNEEYFDSCQVVVNCATNEKKIIPLHATMIDTWHVDFVYLDRYKETCFAEKKTERKDLRIADYGNIRDLTLADVKTVLGYESMDLLKSRADDEVKVQFNGKSTYTVTLTYSYATIRMSEASSRSGELKVPLSCYADWCDGIGKDWSIMYLNNPEHKYFNYSNDVNRENLYGYFASVVFTEQLKDINTWFAQESGEGAVVLAKAKEIRGSDLYKFIRNNTLTFAVAGAVIGGAVGGGIGGAVGGSAIGVGLNLGIAMLCEATDSANATYYTYFTYLDCSSSQAFLSRSGATDAYDTDGALKNTVQKAGDIIGSLVSDTGGTLLTVLGVLLGVIAAAFAVAIVIKIIGWAKKSGGKKDG